GIYGQFEGELGPASRTVAVYAEGAVELSRRKRPTMQPKPVTAGACRESVIEYTGQIPRSDSHPVVDHGNSHSARGFRHPHRDAPIGLAGFVAGVLRVAYEVHQNLQELM